MGIIAAGLAAFFAVLAVVLLVAFRAGTRRQEQTGSLADRASGRAAGLTRRVTGLYAEVPPAARRASPGQRAADRSDFAAVTVRTGVRTS